MNILDNDKRRNPVSFLQQQEADKRPVGKGCSISKIVFLRVFKRARSRERVTLWFAWPFAFHFMCGSGAHALIVNYLAVKLGARYCLTRAEWPWNKTLWEHTNMTLRAVSRTIRVTYIA